MYISETLQIFYFVFCFGIKKPDENDGLAGDIVIFNVL